MTWVDIMSTGDGWYSCADWCGREVTERGSFCPHCAWDDAFHGATLGFDYTVTLLDHEIQMPFRGEPVEMLDTEPSAVL